MSSRRRPAAVLRSRRLATFLLASSWCVHFAPTLLGGRPVDAGSTSPAPSAPLTGRDFQSASETLPLPAERDLIAATATTTPQVLPEPIVPPPAPAGAEAPTGRVAPSQSVTVNLINRLVERGVLTKEDSSDLMKQAEADAAEARSQAVAQQEAAVQAAVTQAVAAAQAQSFTPDPALMPTAETVRVTYIPEVVKSQLREQIKQEVMAQARDENWAAPHTLPEWVTRFKLFGDIRVRGEGDYFPEGNDNTGAYPNFNAINTGAPFDVSGTVFSPQLNVDQDRQRLRLRARFGIEADLGEGFSAGLRIATGENNSPVSTNQSFGLANQAQGGNFSKYAIWLDRAFLKYEAGGQPGKNFALTLGRFDNPFFSTDIIWDDDVGFDGIALQARYEVVRGLTPFLTAGAFPVFNTDFNFSSNQPAKFKSDDKWLYGAQLGTDWKIRKDLTLKLAAAYYHFDNVEGKLSDPFTPLTKDDAGNTDNTRPSFAQKGNTYMALRNIVPNALNNFGTTNQFQYFGLATPFHELALTGRLDYNGFEPVQITLSGEWVKNLAFDHGNLSRLGLNNRGPDTALGTLGAFDGGDTAWIVNLRVGSAALQKRWDWQLGVNYRHVESDAVVDGFNDSDFGGGGTNLKGYTLYGALALSSRVWLGLRWMSAQEIAGPQFKEDILQLDFNGKF